MITSQIVFAAVIESKYNARTFVQSNFNLNTWEIKKSRNYETIIKMITGEKVAVNI